MSDNGSDEDDCQTTSAPCKNLQTVLDRAGDGADIHTISPTLSLGAENCSLSNIGKIPCCEITSNISFTLKGEKETPVELTCSGKLWSDLG